MSSLPTSTWGTESDANRIKKTYVKGYMDVSGGELSVHNTAFNVFDSTGDATFRVNPQKFTVKDSTGTTVDVSLSYLIFLNNLVPADGVAVSIPDKVKYITTYGTETRIGTTTTPYDLRVYGNTFVDNRLIVGADASLNTRLFVGGDVSLNSNLYVKSKSYLGGDVSLNGSLSMYGGDASLNGRVFVSSDVSLNSNLYVGGTSMFNGISTFVNDASLNTRLRVSGDASLNSRLFVRDDASLNSRLFVGGDASFNGNLFVNRDISLNGGLQIATGKKVGIGKIPGAAYSLDVLGNVNIANGFLHINDSVFSAGGVSLTGNVQVGSNNGFVTVDKSPFYYDPSMTIFYDFDTASVQGTDTGSRNLLNKATGLYDASYISASGLVAQMVDQSIFNFGTASLVNNPLNNQYVDINSTIPIGSSFSVSLWFRKTFPPSSNPERIFDFASTFNENNNTNTIALSLLTNGGLKPILTNGTSEMVSAEYSSNLTGTSWRHVVWNVSPTSSTIYVDGVQLLVETLTNTPLPPNPRGNCFICNTNNNLSINDFAGNIDNFRFYSGRTLSYAEIYQLYTSQSYNLDVSGGILANGSSVIFEPSGTVATARKGTLTLLHGDASGSSSIVFPSVNSFGSDYAYIEYDENIPYSGQTTTESGLFTIGIQSNITSPHIDRICLIAGNENGRVGINTKFPAYTLDVNGAVNATSYNATSDYRVKTDVMALDASFNVDVLKPVTYTNTRHGRQDIGFIAHEVQEHYPFLVNGEKDAEQFQSLNYIGLIGILTKEIQDLKRRLAETEARTTSVENHNQMVNKKMDANMEQVYSMLTSADNHNQTVNKKMDANMEQVYSMLTSAETKVASIEDTIASIENDTHTRFSSVEAKVLYVDTRVATVENKVHSVENTIASVKNTVHSVENTVHSVENTVLSVENTVHSVENTVLLEQARLAICETDVALSKSAIKDLEERFQS